MSNDSEEFTPGMKVYGFRQDGVLVTKEMPEAEWIETRDALLHEWDQAKKLLEKAKEAEMILRGQVVDFMGDPNKDSGTENFDLGGGYKLKTVKKVTYNFVQKDNKIDKKAIEAALQKIEATGPAGELIADRLVGWTPKLSVTEYKQLPKELANIINKVIVIDEATPTAEIVAPKNA